MKFVVALSAFLFVLGASEALGLNVIEREQCDFEFVKLMAEVRKDSGEKNLVKKSVKKMQRMDAECGHFVKAKYLEKFYGFPTGPAAYEDILAHPQCFQNPNDGKWAKFGVGLDKMTSGWLNGGRRGDQQRHLIYSGSEEGNRVAFTFDDGPSFQDEFMPAVLDVLKENEVRATFFVLGARIQLPEAKAVLRRAYEEGHEIQLHGWDQRDAFTEFDAETILSDLEKNKAAIEEALEKSFPADHQWYVRPPWGKVDGDTIKLLRENGYEVVLASKLHAPLGGPDKVFEESGYMVKRTLKSLKPGSIQVFHVGYNDRSGERTWDSPCTALSMKYIIPAAKEAGFNFATISEIVE